MRCAVLCSGSITIAPWVITTATSSVCVTSAIKTLLAVIGILLGGGNCPFYRGGPAARRLSQKSAGSWHPRGMAAGLTELFLEDRAPPHPPPAELEETLTRIVAAARPALPHLPYGERDFARHLSRKGTAGGCVTSAALPLS